MTKTFMQNQLIITNKIITKIKNKPVCDTYYKI